MTSPKLLTIFGATGNQGGSVVDAVLSNPELKKRYKLRGITRNTSSPSAQKLEKDGVEMVSADLNDVSSLKAAVKGSYGVYGMTNFWDKDVMSKAKEIQHGKNLFEAVKSENVTHYVFASLPNVERLTDGVLKHVDHFDGKAAVADHIEANKGAMIASYYRPAIYMSSYTGNIRPVDGTVTMMMPFDISDVEGVMWPVIDPKADGGKYVMGLFEGGKAADGVKVDAVSAWSTPKQFLATLGKRYGGEIAFKAIPQEAYEQALPAQIAREMSETMILVGHYAYYGVAAEKKQAESDKWLLKGAKMSTLEEVVANAKIG